MRVRSYHPLIDMCNSRIGYVNFVEAIINELNHHHVVEPAVSLVNCVQSFLLRLRLFQCFIELLTLFNDDEIHKGNLLVR